jgi:hypothetical protein
MTVYSPAISNSTNVDVVVPAVGTQLTAVASVSTANVNDEFMVSGVLTAADGSIPVGQTIKLQVGADSGFIDVDGATAITDESGVYSITVSESTEGMYTFQTIFAGGSV